MSSNVFGIIAPHPPIMVEAVGGSRSEVTSGSSRSMLEAASLLLEFDPDTIVLMSPHSPPLRDAFAIDGSDSLSGSLAAFGAADVAHSAVGDPEFAAALLDRLAGRSIPAVNRIAAPGLDPGVLDHGVLVPLHFLDPEGRWPLLVLSLSWLDYDTHRTLGEVVSEVADDLGRRIAFVASGDCSHRLTHDAPAGYSPRAAEFDAALVDLIGHSDFEGLMHLDPQLVEEAGECGLRSFVTLGGATAPAKARVLSYERPWGVGYLTAVVNESAVTPPTGAKHGLPGADESEIVALARETIEAYITGEELPSRGLADPELPPRAGVFVSLHREHDLRGCIGTIDPIRPTLAEEVVRNAIEAATADPRFPELGADELADLDISVDVLHHPEPAEMEDLDPARYGVIVFSGLRRGLLLPDLEGVETAQQQVSIARRKAGIAPGEPVQLMRFRVDRYV